MSASVTADAPAILLIGGRLHLELIALTPDAPQELLVLASPPTPLRVPERPGERTPEGARWREDTWVRHQVVWDTRVPPLDYAMFDGPSDWTHEDVRQALRFVLALRASLIAW